MEDFGLNTLKISVSKSAPPAPLRLDWTGKSNDHHPGMTIGPYLSGVLIEAVSGGQAIDMHFEGLEYFNSSTIAAVMLFLQEARRREIRVTVFYRGALRWQRLSFEPLASLAEADGLEIRAV